MARLLTDHGWLWQDLAMSQGLWINKKQRKDTYCEKCTFGKREAFLIDREGLPPLKVCRKCYKQAQYSLIDLSIVV